MPIWRRCYLALEMDRFERLSRPPTNRHDPYQPHETPHTTATWFVDGALPPQYILSVPTPITGFFIMSRKSENGPSPSSLKALRVQIDKLDLHILELLNKRAAVAGQIGKVKA